MTSKLNQEKLSWLYEECEQSHQDIVSGLRQLAISARNLDETDLADDIDFVADRYLLEIATRNQTTGWKH